MGRGGYQSRWSQGCVCGHAALPGPYPLGAGSRLYLGENPTIEEGTRGQT